MSTPKSATAHRTLPAAFDTVEARHLSQNPRNDRTQDWSIGQLVNVGFVRGLLVIDFDGREYTLERNGRLYAGRPHKGLRIVGGAA